MFVYGANFFLFKPGLLLLLLGLVLTVPLATGPITLGPITFALHFMLLGVSFVVLGLQSVYMGILSQVFFDYAGQRTELWFRRFPYSRTVFASAATFAVGLVLGAALVAYYLQHDFRLPVGSRIGHLGVFGLMLTLCGFITFTFVLMLHSTAVALRRRS
jgi:hypothetical protein